MMVDKQHHANAGAAVRERVLPQALILVKSSLLQGQALQVSVQPLVDIIGQTRPRHAYNDHIVIF